MSANLQRLVAQIRKREQQDVYKRQVVHAVIGKFDTTSAGTGLVLLSTTGEPCYVYNFQNRLYMYFYEESKNNLMQNIKESEGGFWYYATPKDYYMKNLEGRFYLPDTEEPVLYYGLEMKRLTGTNSVGYLVITCLLYTSRAPSSSPPGWKSGTRRPARGMPSVWRGRKDPARRPRAPAASARRRAGTARRRWRRE